MKTKRTITLLLCISLLASLLLVGCGKKDEGPDDVPLKLTPAGNVISKYAKDDTDYSSLPEKKTEKVRLHYRRNDDSNNDRSSYQAWNVWAWDMTNGGNGDAYEFTGYDDYGVYADLDLNVISGGRGLDKLGFIIRTESWSKDPDGDRSIDVPETSPGGLHSVWVRTTESTVFDSEENACKSIVSYSMLKDSKTISVYFKPLANDFKSYEPRFSITVNGSEYTRFRMGEYDATLKKTELILSDEVDIKDVVCVGYRFDPTWTCKVDLMFTNYFDTEEFERKYSYSGNDLGATFDDESNVTKTFFKVWAPTSSKIVLNLYNTGDYMTETSPYASYEMTPGERGIFSYTADGDLDGKYYTYTVTNSKGVNEVTDPYAKSAGVNGRRGMVVNFTRLNARIEGWNSDVRPFTGSYTDASIYEIHVRDMTISETSGVSPENRGKFAGLAETGTVYTGNGVTVKTGLDHIKELGVTHVQIQPFYDFSSVDEATSGTVMSADNYNWGYDPQNYNVLEGSYSTDPYDGYCRIIEFKKMVMALHGAGVSINMDVVYNHTSSTENSNLNLLVPYYYYRTKANGAFYNGSGCGNELASERSMVNKLMRDSCRFWIDEYHLSGFRFDLMGLIDNQTMIDVARDCSAIYPSVMIYGEPWTGGATKLKGGTSESKLKEQTTVQESLAQDYFSGSGVLVGAFNDVIRNAIRGENSPRAGFVQGDSSNASIIAMCAEGVFSKGTVKSSAIDPDLVINYASCHDNYTLYDQLIQTMTGSAESRLEAAYTQADAIVFLAEGVPFIQEGEDFMRSKYDAATGSYDGNSYKSGDFVNAMDYSLKVKNLGVFEKAKELIGLRKAEGALRLSSRSEIADKFGGASFSGGLIRYTVGDLTVIHSLAGGTVEIEGGYDLIYSNIRSDYGRVSGSVTLSANESVVLRKAG